MDKDKKMNISFDPIINHNVKEKRKTSNVILDEFRDKFSTTLLNIGHIEIGEKFQGLCYVSDMRMIRNASDSTKYDGRFEFIDGQGRRFRATYWGMDEKFNTHNSLAYVEGVLYTVGSVRNPKKIYRLDKISQSTLDIPRHVFFKNIEGLDDIRNNVKDELDKLVDPEYKKTLEELEIKGLMKDLETVPFDNLNYIELGSRLKIFMTILMDAVNFHKIYELDFDLLRIGTAIALWDPEVKISSKSGREIKLEYNYYVEEIIYGLDISMDTKISLLSFVKKDNKTIESEFVKESLNKYNTLLYSIDSIQEKIGNLVL